MNNFNFEKFVSLLREIKLTPGEKASMRLHISQHMHRHPVGSRPSLYMFRYVMATALMFVLVLGTGGIVAFASQSSLPGEKLYKVKLATEQAKKLTLGTPDTKASYELALIDKRFTETNQLIAKQELTVTNEAIVIAAIKQHTDDFKTETSSLAENNPALALSYNVKLGNTLKTGTHVLLALSNRQSKTSLAPNTLVLAAYASAEKISVEKQQLESIVVSDTNIATIKTAEKRYQDTLILLTAQNIKPVAATSPVTPETVAKPNTETDIVVKTTATAALKNSAIAPTAPTATKEISTDTTNTTDLQSLANALQNAYDAKKYGQVIILCDQIEQQVNEDQKIKEVEKTYNIDISSDSTTTDAKTEVKSETVTSEKLPLLPEIKLPETKTSTTVNP